jgi:hypothetical protein
MAYTISLFEPPPHASFRTTTLRTVAEGYEMDIVFLGNGYVLLRVDLGLLLMGKSLGEHGVMEFVGIKEKDAQGGRGALKWVCDDEEKIMNCRANAMSKQKEKTKKRGRPSKAEVEKRRQEAIACGE